MSLTNSQYDAIMREYDQIQLRNRQILADRAEEVEQAIPDYDRACAEIASLSVEYGKQYVSGEITNLDEYHQKMNELSYRKKKLLEEAGFPCDYLEPVYTCPDCKDTGYVDGKRCLCLEKRIINVLYSQSNLDQVLSTENFSSLSYDYYSGEDLANFRKAVESSFSFVKNFHVEYQNLLFYGAVGTGKSFLSNCIAREILNLGYSVIYFSASGLFELLARYAFDANQKEMLYKTLEDLYNCDLVIIDDLGTEMTNNFSNSHLFTFLNERNLRKKPTIISTNLSLSELKDRYSERIFSRLTNQFTFRKLSGSDIRVLKNIT